MDTLFSFVLPSSWKTLPLSKMNFGGLGRMMMTHVMKEKKILSLKELREEAKKGGAHMIVPCLWKLWGFKQKSL